MLITGLYRFSGKDSPTFTTWEDADINPCQLDVICVNLNLKHFVVFGEIASRYMPIALILDGEAQFSQLYTEYNWLSAPLVEDIAKAVEQIDVAKLREEIERTRWEARASEAEDWYIEQPIQKQLDILGVKNIRETLPKWNAMTAEEKWNLYNQWKIKQSFSSKATHGSLIAVSVLLACFLLKNHSSSLLKSCWKRAPFPIGAIKVLRAIMAMVGNATSRMVH